MLGTLEHSLTGVLVSLAGPLADAGMPIFALSSFDTDYLLVPGAELERARWRRSARPGTSSLGRARR